MTTTPFVDTRKPRKARPCEIREMQRSATQLLRAEIAHQSVDHTSREHNGQDSLCFVGCPHWWHAYTHAFTPTA